MNLRNAIVAGLLTAGVAVAAVTCMEAAPQPSQEAEHWDRVFARADAGYQHAPNAFLVHALERMQREALLQPAAKALDLAMGDGRNAILIAEHGLEVTGIDISRVALDGARATAKAKGLKLDAVEADAFEYDYGKERFDLLTLIYFNPAIRNVDRLKTAVKPGGLILIEGQGSEHEGAGPPPWSRFQPNALLSAFADWRILEYQDGLFASDWNPGPPIHVVRLLARKPATSPR